MAELTFNLDGLKINPPVESRDIEIIGAWINGTVQPNLVTEEFTFVGEAAQKILDYIEAGKTTGAGIFRGMPLTIEAADQVDGTVIVWDGFIDFLKGYEVKLPNKVKVKVSRPDDLERFDKIMAALSYGYLKDKGFITKRDFVDVFYTVIPVDRGEGMIPMILAEYLMVKEFLEAITQFIIITGKVSAGSFWDIITAIFYLIYLIFMIIAIVKMLYEILIRVFPPTRQRKGMTLRKLLTKACEYRGMRFESNIKELDQLVYMPTANSVFKVTQKNELSLGVPSMTDFGYRCNDMFRLASDLFNGQLKVDTGVVKLYTESDPLWIQNSSYILPDVLLDKYTYNIEDAVSTRLFSFEVDTMDEWTAEDFTGTNYEVDLKSTQNIEQKYLILKGYKELRWPVALGSRYGILDEVQTFVNKQLIQLFQGKNPIAKGLANKLIKLVPKNKRPAVKNFIVNGFTPLFGIIKVSSKNFNVPKLVVVGVPLKHRDILSARVLWNKYHSYRSFAAPYTGQRIRHQNIKIPFGLIDFIKLSSNSYFKTASGQVGKFTDLKWNMMHDWATVSFEIFEPYIKSLTETTFEP
jgi:hypothetical protein